ncbi:AMP-binding protein [Acuticoccus sp. MNP-M23]|uniref:class I adenylate-forming enzyme family protein n=1 Tax=Acuticoccus sp. MNP-M23 TaxID=3072793 RepID=UPI00281674A3|nr:AMP-binding protein [Acuticoccus sp. MNP-M23]WMS42439.1 AMP-binding protein [Acuticoccus sp. MNP-M23]
MSDLFTPVERNAAFDPDRVAIRFGGEAVRYADFVARVHAVASGLAASGVAPGDRIAVLAHNHPDTLALLYAAARLGAILVPLNWRLAEAELLWAIAHARPSLLVHDEALAATAAALMPAGERRCMGKAGDLAAVRRPLAASGGADRPCLLVYTSGTTGRPKGALLPQSALLFNAIQSHHMHQMTAADHVLTVLPMFHVGGLNIQTTPALMAGATVTLHDRFDAGETLRAIAADRPTLSVFVPAVMKALLAHPAFEAADLSSLRAIATGSTIVPEPLCAAFEARNIPVLCIYGATETTPIAAYDRYGTPRTKGSTGRSGLLSDIVILDDQGTSQPTGTHGEIAVAGPILSAYFDDDAATTAAFAGRHFRTGDIGSIAADGTLTVHERKKNMIISGGENIYPAEVERVLSAHPSVSACAVVGKPDPHWQETPVAFVVGTGIDPDALVSHMAAQLARYKVPRDIRVVDSLPLTALGKVRHDILRGLAAEGSHQPLAPAKATG